MSDFIYSSHAISRGRLTKEIQQAYHEDKPEVQEFHGSWGSLAVSQSLYSGFQPYETDEHICIVLGAPVLCFQNNKFLTESNNIAGTRAIYERWVRQGIQWDKDLNGPFAILIIYKKNGDAMCVTDLMSFIPVYSYEGASGIMLASHVDMLARASHQYQNPDLISEVDFILHGIVTFPYTCFKNLRQVAPATVHRKTGKNMLTHTSYWLPEERYSYSSIDEAAMALRNGLVKYITAVVENMSHIAHFISGGEDSRTLAGLLPQRCTRDAYVFLEEMNREGRIAKKAAEAYGANFHLATRSKTHYLDIIPACSDLLGSGSVYRHAHTYQLGKICKLDKYRAVFGALFSDTFLKGSHVRKRKQYGFLPERKDRGFSQDQPLMNSLFAAEALEELTERRKQHLKYVKQFREDSAEEWFDLWPCSMNKTTPNIFGNRRLIRAYEPFTACEVIKTIAAVPQRWKLNRRLFHKTAQPFLSKTKWLRHSDGRLPYFPWYVNKLVSVSSKSYRKIMSITGLSKKYEGPWFDWDELRASEKWQARISEYAGGLKEIEPVLETHDVQKIFGSPILDETQQLNLIQQMYFNCVRTSTQVQPLSL